MSYEIKSVVDLIKEAVSIFSNPLDLVVHCAEDEGHDDGINGGVGHTGTSQVFAHTLMSFQLTCSFDKILHLLHILDVQLGEFGSVLVKEGDKMGIWLDHLGIIQF